MMHIILICLLTTFFSTAVEAAKSKKSYRSFQKQPQVALPSQNDVEAQETRLIAMINQERKKYGLKPLAAWSVLTHYAREHSRNMAEGSVEFGHDGFNERAGGVRKHAFCYSVGENVAYTYLYDDPLVISVDMWMKSPGHKENIIGDYTETGIGIWYSKEGRCYLTQLFAKR